MTLTAIDVQASLPPALRFAASLRALASHLTAHPHLRPPTGIRPSPSGITMYVQLVALEPGDIVAWAESLPRARITLQEMPDGMAYCRVYGHLINHDIVVSTTLSYCYAPPVESMVYIEEIAALAEEGS